MDDTEKIKFVSFVEEPERSIQKDEKDPWKVLIIDDEPSVHDITETALSDFSFQGRPLSYLHAYSAKEGTSILDGHSDIALVLLDVILESDNAGLDLIHHIRKELANHITQVVIRTGQPGHAPEHSIMEKYDINDYCLKTDMTVQRLLTVVTASLRAFHLNSSLRKELKEKEKITKHLKASEKRFRDIALHIGDWIWEIDGKGRYTYVSKTGKASADYSSDELKGRHFSSIIEDRNNTLALINKKISTLEPFSDLEIWKKRKDGTTACFLTSAIPIKDDNEIPTGYRGVDKDITDLKKAAQEKEALISQLRQTQRLEAIGTLAGGIAHDFNNILGAILGYTQLLQMDIKENQKGMHYTRQILDGCNRAKNLIAQILDFSRNTTRNDNKIILSPAIVIKEALKLLKASIPSSIKIHTDLEKDAGHIFMDPAQTHQIIMNLCSNAYQAINNNQGNLWVQVKKETVSTDNPRMDLDLPPGDFVAISVRDDGIGIETDAIKKIFYPYFSTKQGGDGTGLGLSVVHGIVTQCNGAVKATSNPNEGTRITAYLPRHEKKGKKISTAHPAPTKGGERILFIDDEEMLVELGESMLKRLGYKPVAMTSAVKALEVVKQEPHAFDIVITDMTMPDIQGTQLAKKIKAIRPDLPIILVTGLSSISDADNVSAGEIDELLSKPMSMNAMAQAIQKLLSP